ncbi:MAG: sulfotransferase [Deltaproteobacteria bacterium]|nr:sulfotransferase [Deltaproteobacteria bacterium]MBW2362081.1 sulfotransferase [Deltaproteobacteria bacterium]
MTRPFVLLATQRTGSTVVWQTLDRHPAVYARGEMFLKDLAHPESFASWQARWTRRLLARLMPRRAVNAYLDGFYAKRAGVRATGFKLMYSQARPEIWSWLLAHRVEVLHLVRRNALKILVSKAAAEATGRRHLRPGQNHEAQSVVLGVEGLVAALDRIAASVEEHRHRIAELRHRELHYEELLEHPQAFFDTAFEFLGVDRQPVELSLRKLTADSLGDALANYDEVAAALAGTRHEALLTPTPEG